MSQPNFLSSIESAFTGVASHMPIISAVLRVLSAGVSPEDVLEAVENTMTAAARRQIAAELGADAHADKYARMKAELDAANESKAAAEEAAAEADALRGAAESELAQAREELAQAHDALQKVLEAPAAPAPVPATDPAPVVPDAPQA